MIRFAFLVLTLVLSAWLAFSLPAGAQEVDPAADSGAAGLTLKQSVMVSDDVVRLGDLFEQPLSMGDAPVVDVSSRTTTRRPAMSGPSMRRCMPCALASLRTTNASRSCPRDAAACRRAVATGSAPSVRPPTASISAVPRPTSSSRSSSTCPTSGAARWCSVMRRRST